MAKMRQPDGRLSASLQSQLDAIFPLFEIDANGQVQVNWPHSFEFEARLFVLANDMNEFFPPVARTQVAETLQSAVWILAREPVEQRSVERLFAHLDEVVGHDGAQELSVVAFLNAHHNQSLSEIRVRDTVFTRQDEDSVQELVQGENGPPRARYLNPDAFRNLHRFAAYSYRVVVPTYRLALGLDHLSNEVTGPFDQMRSLLNFSYHRRLVTHRIGTTLFEKPLARFLASPFFFIILDSVVQDVFFWEPAAPKYEYHLVESGVLEGFRDLEGRLGHSLQGRGSLADLMYELFDIYQKALDATRPAVVFLHFWQILERIASPEREGRGLETDRIIERLNLIAPLTELERQILEQLGELRHEYVHRGAFPDDNGEETSRLLKYVSDKCLNGLLAFLDETPKLIDLREYYSVASNRSEARLAAIERAVSIVRRVNQPHGA